MAIMALISPSMRPDAETEEPVPVAAGLVAVLE